MVNYATTAVTTISTQNSGQSNGRLKYNATSSILPRRKSCNKLSQTSVEKGNIRTNILSVATTTNINVTFSVIELQLSLASKLER